MQDCACVVCRAPSQVVIYCMRACPVQAGINECTKFPVAQLFIYSHLVSMR